MKGLLIKEPWLTKIIDGEKIWEIRGSNIKHRGDIALIRSGSKKIFAVCKIDNVLGPLSIPELIENQSKHQIPNQEITNNGLPYQNTYAYVISNIIELEEPVPYNHPYGAQSWVNLEYELPDLIGIRKTYHSPSEQLRIEFLTSLKTDLKCAGHEMDISSNDQGVKVDMRLKDPNIQGHKLI